MTRFASTTSNLRSSEIRDLMSLATKPGIISFAGGMPGNDLFPIKEIDEIYNNLSLTEKQLAMQYGPTNGLPTLMESLSAYLKKKGLPVEKNRILITTGSLQAINILAKAFIDPGDSILVENPSFIGALSAFKSYQADIIPVTLNSDGISLTALEKAINKAPALPKFLYITPCFHNPAGYLYSTSLKHELIQLMAGKNIPIIEDDAYSDLFFHPEDSERLTPIKAINPEGIDVCYTGSFSKIIGPGLRLGWMLVPPHIYEKCELIKQSFDACSPSFTQVLADKFLRSGAIYTYLDTVRKAYKTRAEAMFSALEQHLPAYVKWEKPRGGFYIWLQLPEGADATEILKKAIDKGAVFVTGKTFDPEGKKNNCLRVSYCNTSPEMIMKGIPEIAGAIREICG
ncbi:MAG: PLP-dependent aminotransferase family protein [Bacteroidales bacterium]|nr:PLP-dependent aminotransferase family protein [Bacteroidales bacterium]